jgi:hypothetical protein
MSKHTPGPWHHVGAWVEVEDDNIPDICFCGPEDLCQDHLEWDWDTVSANAKLISAAPDMLKALRALLRMPAFDGTKKTSEARRKAKRQARSAIAKATGRRA